jgi:hypothetical protein
VEAIRVQHRLALRGGHITQIAEGTGDNTPAVCWERTQLLHGSTHLLTLSRIQVLKCLIALKNPTALIRWHVIQPRQPIQHSLLCLRWKVVETGLILQSPLLLFQRHIAMPVHPLSQMFFVLWWWRRFLGRVGLRRRMSSEPFLASRRLRSNSAYKNKQENDSNSWTYTASKCD